MIHFLVSNANICLLYRRWYISIVPPGAHPGTTEDVDFYAAVPSLGPRHLPPIHCWMCIPAEESTNHKNDKYNFAPYGGIMNTPTVRHDRSEEGLVDDLSICSSSDDESSDDLTWDTYF